MGKLRWLITGVSSGLGKAFMEAAIARGDDVVGTIRRQPDDPPKMDGPGTGSLVTLDVSDPESVARGVEEAAQKLGGIDVVVNNAGAGMFGVIESCPTDDYRKIMQVNFFGTIHVCQAALPHLRKSQGKLVNLSSLAGFLGMGGTSAYSCSKSAVVALSESLRGDLESLGVTVMVMAPGGFRSSFWSPQSNVIHEELDEIYGAYPCGQIAERSSQHTGNEMGDPGKLAELLVDLAHSDDPPFYLVMGADAMELVEAKCDAVAADLEANAAIAKATAYG